MESLDEIIHFILNDSPAWLEALERRDTIVLETQRPQIFHCGSILSQILPSLGDGHVEVVTGYLQQLDQIM